MWGVLQVRDGEKGASINGVLFPAPSDMSEFDKRENGYQRVEVPSRQSSSSTRQPSVCSG